MVLALGTGTIWSYLVHGWTGHWYYFHLTASASRETCMKQSTCCLH